jgi:hypothetical protein
VTACSQLASLWPLDVTTSSSRKFFIRSIPISDAVASVKQSSVCDGQGEAYYFGARTWVLQILKHSF